MIGDVTADQEEPTFNPFEPGFFDDPYQQYDRIRAGERAHHSPLGIVLLHRYADCFDLLRLPGTSVEDRNARATWRTPAPPEAAERGRRAILNLDPPDHTRIRRLVSGTFTMRRLEHLRPRIQVLIDELLTDLQTAGADGAPVDLISGLAFPLPFQVITELLGMPDGNRDNLRAWSHTVTQSLEPLLAEDKVQEVAAASDNMRAHLLDAIEWKRKNPADDLLSALIAAEEDGDRLDTAELLDQVSLLYIAGHETTVNLIGNGMLALLRHRDQYERLLADPDLDSNAVDELLRWDSPVQLSRRITTAPTQLAGTELDAGQMVTTLLGAANRDPEHWGPTAGQLDLSREGAGAHLSFGSGIHHCLGAALARMEGAEVIGPLVRRFPEMELATDTPAWNGRVVLRGLDSLPVSLH